MDGRIENLAEGGMRLTPEQERRLKKGEALTFQGKDGQRRTFKIEHVGDGGVWAKELKGYHDPNKGSYVEGQ